MIKNIIFDMDGVLIDDMPRHVYAWIKALKQYNIKIPKKEFYLKEGASNKQYLTHILDTQNITISEKQKEKIHNIKLETFKKKGKTKPYKILKYLQKLKNANINMAVATGGHKIIVTSAINVFFSDTFSFIITGDDVKNSKPNPEQYEKAVKGLNAKKSETLVIENAPFGIQAAKSAGLKVYAIETTLNKKYLSDADRIFKNHKQLFKELFKELKIE